MPPELLLRRFCVPGSSYAINIGLGEYALQSGASIGVTLSGAPGMFAASDTAGNLQYFFSDNPAYYTKFDLNVGLILDNLGHTITLSPSYSEKDTEGKNGYITAFAKEETESIITVTVNAYPNDGYALSELKYTADGVDTPIVKIGDVYSFIMPDKDITGQVPFHRV